MFMCEVYQSLNLISHSMIFIVFRASTCTCSAAGKNKWLDKLTVNFFSYFIYFLLYRCLFSLSRAMVRYQKHFVDKKLVVKFKE